MTRQDMLILLSRERSKVNALLIAISKWEQLKHYWSTTKDKTSPHYPCRENCALCEIYFKSGCRKCPLGSCDHKESPWKVTTDAIEARDYHAFITGIDMMLYILSTALDKEISHGRRTRTKLAKEKSGSAGPVNGRPRASWRFEAGG